MKNYLLILLIFVFLFGCEKPVEDAQKSYDNKDYKSAYDHLRKIEKEDDVGEVFDKKQKLVLQIIEDIKEKDYDYTQRFFNKLLDEKNENYSTIQNQILMILKKEMDKHVSNKEFKLATDVLKYRYIWYPNVDKSFVNKILRLELDRLFSNKNYYDAERLFSYVDRGLKKEDYIELRRKVAEGLIIDKKFEDAEKLLSDTYKMKYTFESDFIEKSENENLPKIVKIFLEDLEDILKLCGEIKDDKSTQRCRNKLYGQEKYRAMVLLLEWKLDNKEKLQMAANYGLLIMTLMDQKKFPEAVKSINDRAEYVEDTDTENSMAALCMGWMLQMEDSQRDSYNNICKK